MTNAVRWKSLETTGPTYDLWADCPVEEIIADPNVGIHFFDNFVNCPTWSAPAGTLVDKYNVYGDTGVVIGPAGLQGGGLKISGNDADNDEGTIQVGGGGFVISDTAANAKKLWFEACFQKASVADNALAFFLGLLTPGSAAADIQVDDTGAMAASKSYIGFHTLHTSGEELDFVWGDSTSTVVTWGDNIGTLEAATDYKMGFKYDPGLTRLIEVWLDGVCYKTDYVDAADIAHATSIFPDGDVLAPALCTKVGAAAEIICYMKWWRAAQLF